MTGIPYFPTVQWVRENFHGGELPKFSNREMTRATLPDGRVLSVPVCGGASALKREPFNRLLISDHGKWQNVHDRSLEAVFGRTPFFRHLYPLIRQDILDYPERMEDLTGIIYTHVADFIGLDSLHDEFLEYCRKEPRRVAEIKKSLLSEGADTELFFSSVCRLGADAIFLLDYSL